MRFSNLALGVWSWEDAGQAKVWEGKGRAESGGGVKTVCRVSGAGTNRIFLRPGRRRHWLRTV